MNNLSSHRLQRGYLMEIPILLMVAGIVVAVLFPNLPPAGQKILVSIAAVPVLFALYYMLITPGWMPADKSRLRPPWNWLVFLLSASLVFAVIAMIFLG